MSKNDTKKQGNPADERVATSSRVDPAVLGLGNYNVLMGQRRGFQGNSGTPVAYQEYSDWATQASSSNGQGGVKITKDEWKDAANRFGWSRAATRRYKRDYRRGGGPNLSAMIQGLQRRYYIDNGKLYTEGTEDFDPTMYETAQWASTDKKGLIRDYNADVDAWRKLALETMYYDPVRNAYFTPNGYNNSGEVQLNGLKWFDSNTAAQTKALYDTYRTAVDTYNSGNLFSEELLGKTLKFSEQFNPSNKNYYRKLKGKAFADFKKDVNQELLQYLANLRKSNTDGSFNYTGNVKADALVKYLHQVQYPWVDLDKLQTSKLYTQSSGISSGSFSRIRAAKTGTKMNYIYKALSGYRLLRISRTLAFQPEQFNAFENSIGINRVYSMHGADYYLYKTPTSGLNLYVPKSGSGEAYWANSSGDPIASAGNFSANGAIMDNDLVDFYLKYADANNFMVSPGSVSASSTLLTQLPQLTLWSQGGGNQQSTQRKKAKNPASKKTTPKQTSTYSYGERYKNGGSLSRVNYFAPGGAVAAPAQQTGNSLMLAQVGQLVQSAIQGDLEALQAIMQIMQAAESDPQAAEIMNMIAQDPNAQQLAEVLQNMQAQAGQAPMSKNGSKISYLKTLKTGCPEGYEVSYHKKGGHLCKECVKKSKKFLEGGPVGNDALELLKNGYINQSTYQLYVKGNSGAVNQVKGLWKKYAAEHLYPTHSNNKALEIPEYSMPTYTAISNKKGGELRKLAVGGKKKEVEEAKCGAKARKKCENGGFIERLLQAFKTGGNIGYLASEIVPQ